VQPLSQMVWTVKKSQATIPEACWRRSARPAVADGCGRIHPVAWRGADRGRRDPHAEPEQLPPDALVAPARVLAGQPNDQLLQLLVELRSPCCMVWAGLGAREKAAVPAQQRLGPDKKENQRELRHLRDG
jgi:hypothetical protein